MQRVTSTKFQRAVGEVMFMPRRAPLTITNRGRDELVLVNAQEFNRLKELDKQSLYAWEAGQVDVDAIAQSEPSVESENLNYLLD